jgi:hypothetical protein
MALDLALARWAVVVVVLSFTAKFFYTFYERRTRFRQLTSKYGLVGTPKTLAPAASDGLSHLFLIHGYSATFLSQRK